VHHIAIQTYSLTVADLHRSANLHRNTTVAPISTTSPIYSVLVDLHRRGRESQNSRKSYEFIDLCFPFISNSRKLISLSYTINFRICDYSVRTLILYFNLNFIFYVTFFECFTYNLTCSQIDFNYIQYI
jgi:hypothetical protein